jgi:hypothetical protein
VWPFPFRLSSFLFIFSLVFILAPRPDDSKPPPPPPLYSTTFRSTPQSPDLVLHEGDLTESLGGSSLLQIPSLLSARFDFSGGRRDLLRQWILHGHWVWRFISACVSIKYLTLRVDYSKLFLKSPYHTRIEWQIRFDLYVVYLAGITDLNFLLVWTLAAVDVLTICWNWVKLCVVCCCCDVVVVVVVFFLFLFCIAALCVGFFAVMNVTFSPLRVLYPSM